MAAITNLVELLDSAATSSATCTFYPQGSKQNAALAKTLTYAELRANAQSLAPKIRSLAKQNQTGASLPNVLLHFEDIQNNITWFWAAIYAGVNVAISTPLPANLGQRRKHLQHVSHLLEKPLVITTPQQLFEVQGVDGFSLATTEQVRGASSEGVSKMTVVNDEQIVLMLTSGSSGNAKAVELRPSQLVAASKGKSAMFNTTKSDKFLNWIGFDHVANMTETHLHAMYVSAAQYHVPAGDVISTPELFLGLINEHRITASFAPNFYMARLVQHLEDTKPAAGTWDLSCLRRINSGGEANLTDTAAKLNKVLGAFGATNDLVVPGFGMTETCAGSIYNTQCPSYDVKKGTEFTSLGKTVQDIEMRIVKDDGTNAGPNELGLLQVRGAVVFKRYYNNFKATEESFTTDGWFNTGDKAFVDENGNLALSGREKETININGVKYAPQEIEAALEEDPAETGCTPSWTAVFSVRPQNSQMEEICVLYHANYDTSDIDARIRASNAIVQSVGIRTSSRPKHIVPLPQSLLPKSSLGKLSRAKLRTALEKGEFAAYEDRLNADIKKRMEDLCEPPSTETEKLILAELQGMLSAAFVDMPIGVNNSIFDFGVTSTDLFLLGSRIQKKTGIDENIPVGTLLTDPTIRGIAKAIEELDQTSDEYVPIVPLQKEGDKTPLFLVHPGSGDVLIFVALAKYFPDRPIYGIRTRALYSGDNYFKDLHEMSSTYYNAIKKIQPKGPYAIAGYSLGSSVAWEVGKLMEAGGDEVPFMGILDSPPHIRHLIGNQDFIDVLLNVAYFLELITAEYAMVEAMPMHELSDDDALDMILGHAPPARLAALNIDKERLRKITWVTHSFGKAGKYYEPEGSTAHMDVFWVHPLLWVANDRKQWMDEHLRHWVNFVREPPVFHECEGAHSLMLNADFVDGIAKKLRSVLAARGV